MEREMEAEVAGQRVAWRERRLVVRSLVPAARQRHSLETRLRQAHHELAQLTARTQGQKRLSESALCAKADSSVARQRVTGLLHREGVRVQTQTPGRRSRGREARLKEEQHSRLNAHTDAAAVAAAPALWGWHVSATTHRAAEGTVALVVLASRAQSVVARGLGRLTGPALAVRPLLLRKATRVVGLRHVLVIALRVLTLIACVVRRQRKDTGAELGGLSCGHPQRATARPTSDRLLEAFAGVPLTWVEGAGHVGELLAPLAPLQERLLHLLGFSSEIYGRLVHQCSSLQVLQFPKPAPT
jgi:transposase